ncbi:MAG TPA: DUF3108 domain-containing protein [Pyrinomonadaceae bacterium]|nr:DUF3108 domain-containing protein [Pyrinomonadaceae bacterium]
MSNSPYKVGERLTYIISYSSFSSAAHVQVQVLSRGNFGGRDAIQLQGQVKTTELINVALIALNNDYTTFIDPRTGLPFRSQQVTRDAISSSESFHDFSQTTGDPAGQKQATIPGTFDFLSVFYRLRSLPLTNGSKYTLKVWTETEEYQIELRVTGNEVVRTNIGNFNSIATEVRVSSSSQTYKIKARFSEDDRHVPVLLTAKVRGGEIRAELAGSMFVEPPPAPAATPTAQPAPTPRPAAPETPPAHVENWPFTVGEELNYRVFLGDSNAPAGTATFQVRGRSRYFERDGLLLTVKAQTTGTVARLFLANDEIKTYVDPKALLPYRTELNLVEGKRRKNQTLTINQDTGAATTSGGQRISIPIGTHDYLSFFYALRTFNLAPQRRNAISILIEDAPKTLVITALKREMIGLGQQTLPAIPLTLTTPEDPQNDKYQLRIWVSDDRRRLPLRITANTELGPIRADLIILPTVSQ